MDVHSRLLRKFSVLCFLGLFSGLCLSAQTTPGGIAGSVQDSAGAVFVSAKVEIQPSGRQVATDDQGQFRFPNLIPGQYTLKASYLGFKPFETNVMVPPGQTANVSAMLKVASDADTVMV